MPEISVDVEIYCSCGEGLCRQSSASNNKHSCYITVEPCQKCLDLAREDGKNEGYEERVKEEQDERTPKLLLKG